MNEDGLRYEMAAEKASDTQEEKILILYNDDNNTFEHVIECLVLFCKHSQIQAEQCAYITNAKGKCEIKRGKVAVLRRLRTRLLFEGLKVEIE